MICLRLCLFLSIYLLFTNDVWERKRVKKKLTLFIWEINFLYRIIRAKYTFAIFLFDNFHCLILDDDTDNDKRPAEIKGVNEKNEVAWNETSSLSNRKH